MNKIIVFILASLVSVSGFADHHKGDRDKDPKHEPSRRSLFKHADLDGDDKISYAEHETMVQEMSDNGRAHFQAMDTDSDGFVTKKEARKAREENMKGMRKKREVMENKEESSED